MRKILVLVLIITYTVCSAVAQRSMSDRQKRTQEAKAAGGEQLEKYKAGLLAELKGNDERVYREVAQAFYDLGMEKTVDSIWAVVKKKFPRGEYARNSSVSTIYDEKDPVKKEKLYLAWLKRFPAEKLGEDIVYDYVRCDVGAAWAAAGEADKAMLYAKALVSKVWRGEGYSVIAGYLRDRGDLEKAAELYKMAVENVESVQKEGGERSRFAMIGYPSYLSAYADICYQLGRKAEALEALEKLPADRRTPVYAAALAEAGRPMEAFLCLWEMVRKGNFDARLLEKLKSLYVTMNGSDRGFDSYIEGLRKARADQKRREVAESIISEPAPDFTLTDTEGNVVKLSELRGKVVVLDFWATWCGPCKRSFPAMQKAVDKYKNDPEVVFLFIHTWEREENATESAVKFLKENNYSFRLLMDLKDPETKANTVVKSYGVNGIPAKFVIDPQGNIRFKVTGAAGSDEEIVAELSQMIEMARKTSD